MSSPIENEHRYDFFRNGSAYDGGPDDHRRGFNVLDDGSPARGSSTERALPLLDPTKVEGRPTTIPRPSASEAEAGRWLVESAPDHGVKTEDLGRKAVEAFGVSESRETNYGKIGTSVGQENASSSK